MRICMLHIYESAVWLADVQCVENDQDAESLDLSRYNRLGAPKQILCLHGAKQGPRDSHDPRCIQDIDPIYVGKSGCDATAPFWLPRSGVGPQWLYDWGSETIMADDNVDPSLQRAIKTLDVPGLLIGHRMISHDDELALLQEEMASLSFLPFERRRSSGAARRVARELMNSMGFADLPILREYMWRTGLARRSHRLDGSR